MDIVFIEDLRIETVIGIYDWERGIRQTVALDVEMAFDNRVPAASDDIAHTLDYKAVSKRLISFVEEANFGLVETLAERCAKIIREEFGDAVKDEEWSDVCREVGYRGRWGRCGTFLRRWRDGGRRRVACLGRREWALVCVPR